jgi:hypothetical protein
MTMTEIRGIGIQARAGRRSAKTGHPLLAIARSIALRLLACVGLAVAAGRFSSSSGGIGPWQC